MSTLLGVKADTGRKYRAYPTEDQESVLTRWGHTGRALWNVALEQRVYLYRQRVYTLRSVEQCKHLTAARAELEWMEDLPAQAAGQQVLRRLDAAYDNFWNPDHPAKFPARKKRGHRLSIPFPGQAVEVRKLNRKWAEVRIPKLGWLRFRLSRAIGGTVRNASVEIEARARRTGGTVTNSTRSVPRTRVPATGRGRGWSMAQVRRHMQADPVRMLGGPEDFTFASAPVRR